MKLANKIQLSWLMIFYLYVSPFLFLLITDLTKPDEIVDKSSLTSFTNNFMSTEMPPIIISITILGIGSILILRLTEIIIETITDWKSFKIPVKKHIIRHLFLIVIMIILWFFIFSRYLEFSSIMFIALMTVITMPSVWFIIALILIWGWYGSKKTEKRTSKYVYGQKVADKVLKVTFTDQDSVIWYVENYIIIDCAQNQEPSPIGSTITSSLVIGKFPFIYPILPIFGPPRRSQYSVKNIQILSEDEAVRIRKNYQQWQHLNDITTHK